MDEIASWKAQEAARYLDMVRHVSLDLRRIQDEIEVQRSLLPGMDYSREKVSKSPNPDSLELAALRVLDLIEAYCVEQAEYIEMQYEAHQAVKRMEDARYRAVLTLYYITGHSWETVGDKLGYTPNHCQDLRQEALPLFWDVMPKEHKTNLPRAD